MANKTKNELMLEIEELRKELDKKTNDIIKYEQISTCADMGEEYKLIYDSYVNAGFTQEQAFDLLTITVQNTVSSFMRDIRNQRISYRRYY